MTQIIIMAAGKGTRMKTETTKVLVPLKERPMIDYLLSSIQKTEPELQPIIIVSPDNKDAIQEALKKYNVQYAVQEKQLGTGNAVVSAKDCISPLADNVFVLNGDHPFYTKKTIKEFPLKHQGILSMVTVALPDFEDWRFVFSHLGRVVRDEKGYAKKIVEFKDATEQEQKIKEINLNCFCFNKEWLFSHVAKLNNTNKQGEYYITDLVKMAFDEGHGVKVFSIPPEEGMGINSLEELAIAESLIN